MLLFETESNIYQSPLLGSLLQKAKMFHSLLDNRLTSLDLVGFFSPGI